MNIFFLIFAQNIECGYTLEPPRQGGSNEYQQSMFWSKIRKIGIPLQTHFNYIKVGFKGVFIARTCVSGVHILSSYLMYQINSIEYRNSVYSQTTYERFCIAFFQVYTPLSGSVSIFKQNFHTDEGGTMPAINCVCDANKSDIV